MTKRLLVGIGETAEMTAPRAALLALLERLRALDVEIQAATFGDGPVGAAMATVADVCRLEDLPRRSPSAVVEGAVRRVSPAAAAVVQDVRTRHARRWVRPPDAIHLDGARAMPLLRVVRSPDVPVTMSVHPWDWSIAGLPPRDRRELVARTRRFWVADDSVIEPLLAAGVDPSRIDRDADPAWRVPDPPASARDRARARVRLGLPTDRPLVTVFPVPDWTAMPDLTLALAWEVERLGGPGAPNVEWFAMPASEDDRWPLEHDIRISGLRRLRLGGPTPSWPDVVEASDAVVLPMVGPDPLPPRFGELAARRATPIVCWEGHPRADEVARWGGTVAPRADVEALASAVWSAVASPEDQQRARYASWGRFMADAERFIPLGVPVP